MADDAARPSRRPPFQTVARDVCPEARATTPYALSQWTMRSTRRAAGPHVARARHRGKGSTPAEPFTRARTTQLAQELLTGHRATWLRPCCSYVKAVLATANPAGGPRVVDRPRHSAAVRARRRRGGRRASRVALQKSPVHGPRLFGEQCDRALAAALRHSRGEGAACAVVGAGAAHDGQKLTDAQAASGVAAPARP
jgi:hypothetical protein